MQESPGETHSVLTELEAGLSPFDYDRVAGAFRGFAIPGDVDSDTLSRIYRLCYRILGIAPDAPAVEFGAADPRYQGHIQACAISLIEDSLFDAHAHTREWIRSTKALYESRGDEVPEGLDDNHLPPAITIPWDKDVARQEIAPFLTAFESNLATDACAHFKLCYDIAASGYPVFRDVFDDWLDDLERRGLGQPGMRPALAKAKELERLAEKADPIRWQQCEAEVLPLLEDPHPMIAAGAARYIGALFADDGFPKDQAAPALPAFLDTLSRRDRLRRAVCGAFIRGFDTECCGLGSLVSDQRLQGFDLDEWVIEALSLDEDEPFLPNVQALWFYVHEHYDTDPGFITRLIDLGRPWVAMMCATERPERVEGMEPVLHRLADLPDPEVSAVAEAHLRHHYSH